MLSAHAHARATSADLLACRLVHATKHYWFMRGLLDLGHRVAVEALSIPVSEPEALLGAARSGWPARSAAIQGATRKRSATCARASPSHGNTTIAG